MITEVTGPYVNAGARARPVKFDEPYWLSTPVVRLGGRGRTSATDHQHVEPGGVGEGARDNDELGHKISAYDH